MEPGSADLRVRRAVRRARRRSTSGGFTARREAGVTWLHEFDVVDSAQLRGPWSEGLSQVLHSPRHSVAPTGHDCFIALSYLAPPGPYRTATLRFAPVRGCRRNARTGQRSMVRYPLFAAWITRPDDATADN
jgi:hypothetical protein